MPNRSSRNSTSKLLLPKSSFLKKALPKLLWVVIASTSGISGLGCTPVAPYERGKLAHPTMTAADLASMGEQHLRAIDEGATGGSAGTGSGCGCN